jgi:hypothetical protein
MLLGSVEASHKEAGEQVIKERYNRADHAKATRNDRARLCPNFHSDLNGQARTTRDKGQHKIRDRYRPAKVRSALLE